LQEPCHAFLAVCRWIFDGRLGRFERGNAGLRVPSDSDLERREKRQTLAALKKKAM